MIEQNRYLIFYPHNQNQTSGPSVASDNAGRDAGKLASCEAQLAEVKEKFVRASADFENFKKRTQRDQAQWFDQGQSRVITQLLPIVDDFDRALAQQKVQPSDAKAWGEGFELIHKSLQKMLESFDVKEISADLPFDPELHEALVSVEDSGRPSGEVVEILQKGYLFRGKVLRPAKVSVAK